MISWKHSFNRLNEEYEIAKKKQQALDSLYEKGRISLSTRDSFNNEIAVAIAEIEKQQQDLLQKMHMKTEELGNQIKTLEMLLANYEIQHVGGEIDEETYQLEINLLASGLTTAKHELENIKEAANHLRAPDAPIPEPEPIATPQVEAAPAQCTPNAEIAVEAPPAEIIAAPVTPEPCLQEPIPEPVAAPTPEPAAPVAEAVVAESAPILEVTVEVAAPTPEPTIAEPKPVAAVEEIIVEQPAVEIEKEPAVEEIVAPAEAAIVEETITVVEAEKVEPAPEPIIEESAEAEEIAIVEPAATTVEAEVVQAETVETDVPPTVEEIATANPFQAPSAAQTETPAETAPEVSAETPLTSTIPSAKEVLPVIESTSDSSESKES